MTTTKRRPQEQQEQQEQEQPEQQEQEPQEEQHEIEQKQQQKRTQQHQRHKNVPLGFVSLKFCYFVHPLAKQEQSDKLFLRTVLLLKRDLAGRVSRISSH